MVRDLKRRAEDRPGWRHIASRDLRVIVLATVLDLSLCEIANDL